MPLPKIVATLLARLDQWSIEFAIRAALEWCDEVVIGMHEPGGKSLDPTWKIIAKIVECPVLGPRLNVIALTDETWDEMNMRQRLLARARELNATHIAIVDADEAVTADLIPTIREAVLRLKPCETIEVPMVAPHHGSSQGGASLDFARVDGVFNSARITLAFGDDPSLSWQNAADGYCYHNRPPKGITQRTNLDTADNTSGVFHLQYATLQRLGAKAAYYKIVERMKFPDRDESQPGPLNHKYDWTLRDEGERYTPIVPSRWAYSFGDGRKLIDLAEIAWQAWAVSKLVDRVDPKVIAGLDLHRWSWAPLCHPSTMPGYAATF